jgi:hypothetical protein
MDPSDPEGPCTHCRKAGLTAKQCGGQSFPIAKGGIAKPSRWRKGMVRFLLEHGQEDSPEIVEENAALAISTPESIITNAEYAIHEYIQSLRF